uniref:BapA/Bap/LapF family prefix-like domain-containing protein n=1 Tax=Acinetobacter sp. F-1 TaxID=1796981 RepID=UPI001FD61E59
MQVQVISKVEGSNQLIKEYLGKISLNKGSVVLVDIRIEDIEKIEYLNNQAAITLKNGEKILIENFDKEESSLVFRNENSELYLFDFETISYNPIDKIEPLLYPTSEVDKGALFIWPIALASGAGIIAAVANVLDSKDSLNGKSAYELYVEEARKNGEEPLSQE